MPDAEQSKADPPRLDDQLSRFIIRLNIAHYQRLAIETTDPAKRAVIKKLLAQEEEKLVDAAIELRRAEHERGVVM